MQQYEIWSEGFISTGQVSNATWCGTVTAESFQAACDEKFKDHKNFYKKEKLTYWGCRLFDNEADARRSFG